MSSNKEHMRIYVKMRYHRRRSEWVEALGGKCTVCFTTEQLEFDHVDPSAKSYSISKILSGGSEEKVSSEMAKCQLLCHEHHKVKTKLDRMVL